MESSETTKLQEPGLKQGTKPREMYQLLGVSWRESKAIQAVVRTVYEKHKMYLWDIGYKSVPDNVRKRARDDLVTALPLLFAKCDGDWFAEWALGRRHKTRKGKGGATSEDEQGQASDNEGFSEEASAAEASGSQGPDEIKRERRPPREEHAISTSRNDTNSEQVPFDRGKTSNPKFSMLWT